MLASNLVLINFRNYRYESVELSSGCNLFFGKNAQGKTNLLESVYLTSRGTSFKAGSDRDMIRFGERSGYVLTRLVEEERVRKVECKISMVDRKRIRINEIEQEQIRELTELFPCVLFAPEHLELVQAGPAVRRHFLDELLSATDVLYAKELRRYERVLTQRNQLLKKHPAWLEKLIGPLDVQLAEAGSVLVKKRFDMTKHLSRQASPVHGFLSSKKEMLEIGYVTNASENPEEIKDKLLQTRARDLEARNTEIGPHRDDLNIRLNQYPARVFASQGQARTITLACKLAEAKIREERRGRRPVLLLDDVFSELDETRARALLQWIAPYQSLVTTNEKIRFPEGSGSHTTFEVINGSLQALQ